MGRGVKLPDGYFLMILYYTNARIENLIEDMCMRIVAVNECYAVSHTALVLAGTSVLRTYSM